MEQPKNIQEDILPTDQGDIHENVDAFLRTLARWVVEDVHNKRQ